MLTGCLVAWLALQAAEPVRLDGDGFAVLVAPADGSLRLIDDDGARLAGVPVLWRLRDVEGAMRSATDGPAPTWARQGRRLRLTYSLAPGQVEVTLAVAGRVVEVGVEVVAGERDVLSVAAPATVHVPLEGLRSVLWPAEIGVALQRAWFAEPRRVADTYPPLFSDLLHVEALAGDLAIYGVQDARDPAAVLVPTELGLSGEGETARLAHAWRTHVPAGRRWRSPMTRLMVGLDRTAAVERYAADNHLRRPLTAKLPSELLADWQRGLLVRLEGRSYKAMTAALAHLPQPSLVFVQNFLRHGFDTAYPDLLPPNPALGTEAEFRELLAEARRLGHRVMPYANNTWWGDDPPGPTFERVGDVALARDFGGVPLREIYGPHAGWLVTPWHPAVVAAHDAMTLPFRTSYPADVQYLDQAGARGAPYDFNPAAPTPYAYAEGLLRLVERTAERAPVAVEGGWDRLLPSVSGFAGLTWSLHPTQFPPGWPRWAERWPSETWRIDPLARRLGAGSVIVAHHLAQDAAEPRALALAVLLGYQLSRVTSAEQLLGHEERRRLAWLGRLQAVLGPRMVRHSPEEFTYLVGSGANGVVHVRYGDVTVVTNLSDSPIDLGPRRLPPDGFWVEGGAVAAGEAPGD